MKEENFVVVKEEDLLFEHQYICPVCDAGITIPGIRSSKLRFLGHDEDLRPKYQNIDVNKYSFIFCNKCGYARLLKLHVPLRKMQKDAIIRGISNDFEPLPLMCGILLSHEDAIERGRMAMKNALAMDAKNSEIGYIQLVMSWNYRGMREELLPDEPDYEEQCQKCLAEEKIHQKLACEYFERARLKEDAPYSGFDEITLDFILGYLLMETGKYADATRLLHGIIQLPFATRRHKDQAYDMMQEIKKRIKLLEKTE